MGFVNSYHPNGYNTRIQERYYCRWLDLDDSYGDQWSSDLADQAIAGPEQLKDVLPGGYIVDEYGVYSLAHEGYIIMWTTLRDIPEYNII